MLASAVVSILLAGIVGAALLGLRLAHSIGKASGLRVAQLPPLAGFADPWPTFRGPADSQLGSSSVVVPKNLSASLRWKWHHPAGRYNIVVAGGPVIDAAGNLYLSTSDGIRKLSPQGKVLWHHPVADRRYNNQASLWQGMVFSSTETGLVFALDQADGRTVWERKLAAANGGDCGYPAASDGVLVVGANAPPTGGNFDVHGLDAASGRSLWRFKPADPVWNFAPLFPRNGMVTFMDFSGGMYGLDLHSGALRWYTPVPRKAKCFSDGGAVLGRLGDVFSCSNPGGSFGNEGEPGLLRRLRLSDGAVLWQQPLPQPCNSYPAVGDLGPGTGLSVVVTPGSFMGRPNLHGSIMAFDVLSGGPRWRFNLQAYSGIANQAKGDAEGWAMRLKTNRGHEICLPAHWSSANIDGDGFAYAGRCDGWVYGVRARADAPPPEESGIGLSKLGPAFSSSPGLEVRRFNADGAPLHGAMAFGPGTVAYASCDTLYVFNA